MTDEVECLIKGDILNLANKKDVKSILEAEGFSFKKSLGQNFLIDDSVCPRMAESAAGEGVGVLEIGPGAGVLTRELSERAERVVAIELDERLRPVLSKTLEGCRNVKIVWGDVLKVDLKKIIAEEFGGCHTVNICANLPYYITSPVIMMLLESHLPINSITVMVQKEAADRLCAEVGSRAAGAVTVAVNYYSEAEQLFGVPRGSFLPPPNVDSAVIRLNVRPEPPVKVADEALFFRIAKACFAQRRKTLLNTVSNTLGFDKAVLREALNKMGLPESVRGETLSMEQLAELTEKLFN